MNEVQGYYKDKKVNVKFDDTTLSVGTKKYKYDDIYYIQSDVITNYGQIVTNAFTVGMASIGIILGILVTNAFSIGIMAIFALVGFLIGYYFSRTKAVKENGDQYLKIIDIYFKDTHESVVVPYNFTYNKGLINTEKKNPIQQSVLSKYRKMISATRKYIVGEFEKSTDLSDKELYTKYSTVARDKYGQSNILSLKQFSVLRDSFTTSTGKYTKFANKVARFAILSILVIIVYAFVTRDDLHYTSFF